MYRYLYGGQRSQFSPSSMWVPRIDFGLNGKHLYLLSHLTSPYFEFTIKSFSLFWYSIGNLFEYLSQINYLTFVSL